MPSSTPLPTGLPAPLVGPRSGRAPRHQWRGVHLDCARSFFSVEVIERLLAFMGRYGFTHFHWHLTDNSGWRLDIPGYPELARTGGMLDRFPYRDYTASATPELIERTIADAATRWSRGFYTRDDVDRVLATAERHGIEVVPEIDLPGHMFAATTAYPHLGRPAGVPDLSTTAWGGDGERNDLLWPSDASARFVLDVVDAACEMFPGRHIHLGGDECDFDLWSGDASLVEWMNAHGLNDDGANDFRRIQTWFMRLAANRARSHGKIVAAWDEVAGVDPDGDYLILAWDGAKGIDRVMSTTLPFVYADHRELYLNYSDPDGAADQPGFLAQISVDDILTHPWEPVHNPRCIGIQTCLWTEFVLDEADVWQMYFPRLLAVAERIWDFDGADRVDARERIEREYALLRDHELI